MAREELRRRIDLIEETYEFMLAYAAQGLAGDEGSKAGGDLLSYLERFEAALTGLSDLFRELVKAESSDPTGALVAYLDVLEQDEGRTLAALRLVRAQPSISSQLIDNLNASIHVRALLMDLFLVDEILKLQVAATSPQPEPDA